MENDGEGRCLDTPSCKPINWDRFDKILRSSPGKYIARGILIVVSLAWLTLVVVFDINRFHGYCAKREFNDSVGPLFHEGDRTSCRVENESDRPTPPGKLPGEIFSEFERSQPAWILTGVLSLITTVINFVLVCINLREAGEEDESTTAKDKRVFDHHLNENWRISWIVYGCTAAIVVDYSITLGMIIDCRDGQGAELFYALMHTTDVLLQGAFILTEVAIRRYSGNKASTLRELVFFFLFVNNFVMWGHSIADSVCRYEVDNGAIIGQQLWQFLDPVFGSTIVFFRILSGCLYLSLAVSFTEERYDPKSGRCYLKWPEKGDNNNSNSLKSGNKGMLEFMMSGKLMGEQKMKLYHDTKFTYCYYSNNDSSQQRKRMRSLLGAIVAIPFVTVPFVAYDVLARHAGKEQDSRLKYAVKITTSCLLIIICSILLIWYGAAKIVGAVKTKTVQCCSFWKEYLHHASTHVEACVFAIFTLAAIAFYGLMAAVEEEGDLAADILGMFSVAVHAIFIFSTNFSDNGLKLFQTGSERHTRTVVLLSMLFAVTLGSLAVDIEREHLDHDVHDKPHLRALAPLLVDFRLHAAILTYNVLSEFLDRHRQKDLETQFEEASAEDRRLQVRCSMPCCPAREEDKSEKKGNGKVHVSWKCKGDKCSSNHDNAIHYYCGHCFEDFIIRVGCCPKFLLENNYDLAA